MVGWTFKYMALHLDHCSRPLTASTPFSSYRMSFALYYNDLEPHFISQPPFIHTPQSRIVSASKGDQYPYALSPKSKCKPFSHFLSGFSSPHILSRTSLLRNSRVYQKLRGAFIPPPFLPCFIFISKPSFVS